MLTPTQTENHFLTVLRSKRHFFTLCLLLFFLALVTMQPHLGEFQTAGHPDQSAVVRQNTAGDDSSGLARARQT
jgi:hypothetical protein